MTKSYIYRHQSVKNKFLKNADKLRPLRAEYFSQNISHTQNNISHFIYFVYLVPHLTKETNKYTEHFLTVKSILRLSQSGIKVKINIYPLFINKLTCTTTIINKRKKCFQIWGINKYNRDIQRIFHLVRLFECLGILRFILLYNVFCDNFVELRIMCTVKSLLLF